MTALRHLRIGPVRGGGDEGDLVFGPWCLAGDEGALADWRVHDFPDPFPSPESWVEADWNCRRLANMLVPCWADRMNGRHGCAYSVDFWRVALLTWLTWAIPPVWYRWRYAKDFVARHGSQPLVVPVPSDRADRGIRTTGDLISRLFEPLDDACLSSLVLRALCPPNWTLVPMDAGEWPKARPIAAAPNARRTLAGRVARALFGRLPVQSVPGSRLARLPLSLLVAVAPRGPARVHYRFDDHAAFQCFPAAFLDLLDGYLERVLPHAFGEGFPAAMAQAEGETYHAGRLLLDQLSSESDERRLSLALAHEKGERLVSSQHGGTYGTARAMMGSAAMDYPYHGFLTWGWTEQEDFTGNFIPVPFPATSRFADRHDEREARLVMVGGSMTIRGTRLGWLPTPQNTLRYREAKVAFLGKLAAGPLAALRYRPYRRGHSDIEDEDYVRAGFPDLRLQDGDLNRALLSCRLAVIDHPITTMLTALAANVPTVLYWQRDAWPVARQAEPLFQRLWQVGILHHDAAAAAAQVNRVWDDVPGWWNRSELQEARRAFVRTYARTSRFWWWHWVKALWTLARTKGDRPPGLGQ